MQQDTIEEVHIYISSSVKTTLESITVLTNRIDVCIRHMLKSSSEWLSNWDV